MLSTKRAGLGNVGEILALIRAIRVGRYKVAALQTSGDDQYCERHDLNILESGNGKRGNPSAAQVFVNPFQKNKGLLNCDSYMDNYWRDYELEIFFYHNFLHSKSL